MNQRMLGVTLMLGSAATWAFGIIASKSVLDRTDATPNTVLTVQLGASVALLAVVTAVRRQSVHSAIRHGWTGLFEPGLAYQLTLAGLALTSAANATVLASLEPAVIPLLAWGLLRHRPKRWEMVMTLVATAGAIVVSFETSDGNSRMAGNLLVLGGVVAAAFYVVMSHRHVARHDALTLAMAQQLWALVMTMVVLAAGYVLGTPRWPTVGSEMLGVAASGWCNYAIPFTLYLSALRYLRIAQAAPFLAAIPAFGLLGATTVLGESVSVRQLLGAGVVIGALVVISRGPTAPDGEADAESGFSSKDVLPTAQ
jgi:drug/metabolite transporter (DMT)-like permease